MEIQLQTKRTMILSLALPLALGVIAFFVIIGPQVLNPTNIAWLGVGDPATHYLGWHFYRNSPWEFPVGLNSSYGLELANSIVYSDSNPLLALFFKPFSFLLPDTFQYFGIWLFICFILQAWFGWKLVGLTTSSLPIRILGAGFFVFAPPMIFRMGAHLCLAGHFFIVAALYFAFSSNLKRRGLVWGLLIAATALVHAYLLAMVLAIWLADLGGKAIKKQIAVHNTIFEFTAIIALVGLVCWQAGYFSVGAGVKSDGFGFYRMNLLSIIDSSRWSYVLKDLPQAAGREYEGFNYLGLGIIFLLVLALPTIVAGKGEICSAVGRYWHLLFIILAFALFAVTNTIAIGTFEFKYPLPGLFLKFANIFRASERMFWPVFYVITFMSIVFVVKAFDRRTTTVVLGLALIVQVIDTSAGWLPMRKKRMMHPNSAWSSPLINLFWADAAKKYKNVRYIPIGNHPPIWQSIAYYAGQHGLATNAVYLARLGRLSIENAQRQAAEVIRRGHFEQDSLYILDDTAFRTALFGSNGDTDLFARIDGFNVVAPGWKTCADCRVSVDEINFGDHFQPLKVGERVVFNDSGRGANYLLQGWSTPEVWGTWSDGASSLVFIPTPPKRVDSIYIEACPLITSFHSSQRIDLSINGAPAASMTLKEPNVAFEVKIPEAAKLDANNGLKLEFHFPDAARPKDVGLGEGDRNLALGLVALTPR
jgi:hypothetical protein